MPGMSQVKVQETESKNIDLDSLIASTETKTENLEAKPVEINSSTTPEVDELYPNVGNINPNPININAPVNNLNS